jgi:cytochrome c biogenesis protein CcdA
MMARSILMFVLAIFLLPLPARADTPWIVTGADGPPQVQLYFFWSLTCPHCTAAHPYVSAIPGARPWVNLHELEVSRNADNARRFEDIVEQKNAQEIAGVPAFLFCGEMYFGWESDATTGAMLRERLDACRTRAQAGQAVEESARGAAAGTTTIAIPFVGTLDTASLSLPALTVVLAGLDAFNPCAFFVLLFLLSMMAHQKNRRRMLIIGAIFVLTSGLMYFAFMAAWLNVFELFGHLAWVTLAAGALAVFVGAVNVKDYFWFEKGLTLSIPESKKPDIFRRTRAILGAERLPAMLAATAFLAVAANFYELLCTAGFPMVYTRLLTLADLSPAGRYAYLAAYNLIYVLPLAAIVAVFAGSLGARKLTEREGRLLKLLSGAMMLELGILLLVAPERLGQIAIAFGLMAIAVGVTWIAARIDRNGAGDA